MTDGRKAHGETLAMMCIYCLHDFSEVHLYDEHMIPRSLGGPRQVVLRKAACLPCNSRVVNQWDSFLANIFSPTSMARAELGLKSYSGKVPEMEVVGMDPTVGPVRMRMSKGPHGTKIVAKLHPIRGTGGRIWRTPAHDLESAIRMVEKKTGRKITPEVIEEWGVVRPSTFQVPAPDWNRAQRAVAKLFYCYLLLELGEGVIDHPPVASLRQYVLHGREVDQISPTWKVGDATDVPAHHHLLQFDSRDSALNRVCLFRVFTFEYPLNLSSLAPHGRLLVVDPTRRTIVEAATKFRGQWRFRVSIDWGWRRQGRTVFPLRRQE